MRLLTSICLVAVATLACSRQYQLQLHAFSGLNKSRPLKHNGVISPTESIRVLVDPVNRPAAPDPKRAPAIEELRGIAAEANKVTAQLMDALARPSDRSALTESINAVSQNLTKINTFISRAEQGYLSQEFKSRFQAKSESLFLQSQAITRENTRITSLPEGQRPPLRKTMNLPLEWLGAVNETLNEVVTLAAEDALREGTVVRVQVDLYRNGDKSRVPDTDFLAPADKNALQALMKLRNDLRGMQGGDGTRPIDPSNMGKILVRRFEAEYKLVFDKIKGQLQDSIDELNRKLTAIREKITDSEIERQFEEHKRSYQELVNRFQNVLDTAKKLSKGMDEADANGNPQSDAALLAMWSSQLSSIKTESEKLSTDTRLFVDRFTVWVNNLPTAVKEAIKDLVTDVKKFFVAAGDAIRQLADYAVSEIQAVIRSQIEFLNLVNRLDKIDELTKDDVNGRIELLNKDRQLGSMTSLLTSYDQMIIVIKAHPSGSGDFEPVGEKDGYRIGVFKNNRWDQLYSLTFSPRIGNSNRWQDGLTYGQVFKKAYFSQPIQRNQMMPGFGWSMSVLDQNADSVRELGIGVMMSWLDDRLITGYGFNVSEKHWYPYIGYRFRL